MTMKNFNRIPLPDWLCFTPVNSIPSITLNKNGSPTAVDIEYSKDGNEWWDYSIWWTMWLQNWEKVYFRNKSTSTTAFSTSTSNYYYFTISGAVAVSWDITYLLNKNGTDTLSWDCTFYKLFYNQTAITSCPKIPATTLTSHCYRLMFSGCTNLETIPNLPATWALPIYCYMQMFSNCSKIKLSTTQTWEYQTEYRVPTSWTATSGTGSSNYMFSWTWWTFTWAGSNKVLNLNTTYYTSNTLV